MKMKTRIPFVSGRSGLRLAQALALLLLCCGSACSAAAKSGKDAPEREQPEIGILHVRGNVWMLVGPQSNAAVQTGEQGAMLVDTMDAGSIEPLKKAIESLSDKPIRHVVNTHVHEDHTGGNALSWLAGDTLFNRNVSTDDSGTKAGAPIYAHENVLNEMSEAEDRPFEEWPSSTYFTESKDLYFNGEAVRLFHQPNAHTDGDSIVYFRGSDVIVTGDVFQTTTYPYIDVERGGSLGGIIDALNHIIEIAVPEALQEGGTLIIPGHGRLCDESEVVEYRDMLTIIRGMIQERIKEGMTLSEIQAARPTFGWDVRYAAEGGPQTTEQFVEAIYNELKAQETP